MPTSLKKTFFDSTLMERVKDARPKPTKELEKTKYKTENKAARKLPKRTFKNLINYLNLLRKSDYKRFF